MSGAHGLHAHKRWRLRSEVTIEQVHRFVRDRIVPAYAVFGDRVELGMHVDDAGHVIALQRWRDRPTRYAALSGPAFDAWWDSYLPVLADWDGLVTFVDEWETEVWL